MVVGRVAFTTDDDSLLVKYLATYNPEVKGRSGNKIYKLLVENEHNKWGWSARHPWSGWRDRYVKNQGDFDRRIRRYQREKGLLVENSPSGNTVDNPKGSEDEPKGKRKRASSADARKRVKLAQEEEEGSPSADERDELQSSVGEEEARPSPQRVDDMPQEPPSNRHASDVYPDIATLPEPLSQTPINPASKSREPPSNRHASDVYPDIATLPEPFSRTSIHPASKSKPLVLRATDNDYFASVPPTPTSINASRPPTTASGASNASSNDRHAEQPPAKLTRRLPRLTEGPFGNTFTGVRRRVRGALSDDDSPPKSKEWPPVRNNKSVRADTTSQLSVQDTKKEMDVAPPVRHPRREINAVASSSRVQLAPSARNERENGLTEKRREINARNEADKQVEEMGARSGPSISLSRRRPPQVDVVASSHAQLLPSSSPRKPPPIVRDTTQRSPQQSQTPSRVRTRRTPSPPSPFSPLDWGSPASGSQRVDTMASSLQVRAPISTPTPILGNPLTLAEHSPQHTQAPRHLESNHHVSREPSPLDWGSPVVDKTPKIVVSPIKTVPRRVPVVLPAKTAEAPPISSFGNVERDNRHSQPRHGIGRSTSALPRLWFTKSRFDGAPRSANSAENHSTSSAESGRLTRRSRAPSPPAEAQYHLASPPKAGSSRPQPRSPLAAHSKRHTKETISLGGPAARHPVDDLRRHSYPAAAFPRIDFDSMRITAPRQSLPPRPPPQQLAPLRRQNSLFTPRSSAPTSNTVSPASPPGAQQITSDRNGTLYEQLAQQTLRTMAANSGFSVEVVLNVFARSGDLTETDAILRRMRETAEAVGESALRSAGRKSGLPKSEEHFVVRHHRRASATSTSTRSPHSAPGSSQRKMRGANDEFRPQRVARDVRADAEYTPPTASRAGAFARLAKKETQQRRLSGDTLSDFSRDVQIHAPRQAHVEDALSPTQFAAFASGNVQALRELEQRDMVSGMMCAANVARYMLNGTVPSPYR